MTNIKVQPESMAAYGRRASDIFGDMHGSLESVVTMVTEAPYYGANAVTFKTECGALAETFAKNLHTEISTIADAVRVSVSNIQSALDEAGVAVVITVESKAITAPTVTPVDYVDIDTEALSGIVTPLGTKFDALRGSLDAHLQALTDTIWEGNAKRNAVDNVGTYTTNAKTRCNDAELALTTFITKQVDAAITADH